MLYIISNNIYLNILCIIATNILLIAIIQVQKYKLTCLKKKLDDEKLFTKTLINEFTKHLK